MHARYLSQSNLQGGASALSVDLGDVGRNDEVRQELGRGLRRKIGQAAGRGRK